MNGDNKLIFIFISVSLCFFSQISLSDNLPSSEGKTLHVSNGWSPSAAPVVPTRVAYFSMHNVTEKNISVIAVKSPLFAQVGFHETRTVEGISSMIPMEAIEISAKQDLILEPGGLHLMLINPSPDFNGANTIPLVLSLDNGQDIHIEVAVKSKKASGNTPMGHATHAHH